MTTTSTLVGQLMTARKIQKLSRMDVARIANVGQNSLLDWEHGTTAAQVEANGGAGGYSYGGTAGAAGAATSNLTFDDTGNSDTSNQINAYDFARGGTGGLGAGGAEGLAQVIDAGKLLGERSHVFFELAQLVGQDCERVGLGGLGGLWSGHSQP